MKEKERVKNNKILNCRKNELLGTKMERNWLELKKKMRSNRKYEKLNNKEITKKKKNLMSEMEKLIKIGRLTSIFYREKAQAILKYN